MSTWSFITPVLFALLIWWAATVLMMRRSLTAQPKCLRTLFFISLVAVAGVVAILLSLNRHSAAGAYIGFLGGMSLWAWHEMSYFLGIITGPRPEACPKGASFFRRFSYGVRASLYHELGIILTAGILWWVCSGSANQMALWTFVMFWAMRWSAKLNIFLGVRNLHEEFWPVHLRYLESYVGKPGNNWLFPVSMSLAVAGIFWILSQGFAQGASAYAQTASLLLVTMLALAALEHLFLVLRVPDEWLWRLATKGQTNEAPAVPAEWQARIES